jgi:hypothetical protein
MMWIVEHGRPSFHDLVVLSDGSRVEYVPPGRLVLREVKLDDGVVVSTARAAST